MSCEVLFVINSSRWFAGQETCPAIPKPEIANKLHAKANIDVQRDIVRIPQPLPSLVDKRFLSYNFRALPSIRSSGHKLLIGRTHAVEPVKPGKGNLGRIVYVAAEGAGAQAGVDRHSPLRSTRNRGFESE